MACTAHFRSHEVFRDSLISLLGKGYNFIIAHQLVIYIVTVLLGYLFSVPLGFSHMIGR